ncbi:MAG: hypothetical protein ACK4IX_05370 [Candidatus Sericytochromatia bacterium]
MIKRKTYKYSILFLIIFLQVFDLSCGPSFVGSFLPPSNTVNGISNVTYDEYELFIKESYVYKKSEIVKGKIFYTPNYKINAEITEDSNFKLTSLIISTAVDIGLIYAISTYKPEPKDQIIGNAAKGVGIVNFSLDFLLGLFGIISITHSSFNNDSTKFKEINLSPEAKNYILFDNKNLLYNLKKNAIKEKLSDVTLVLSKECGDDNLNYKVKVESDGSFSMPYLFFNNLKVCTVQFDKDKPYMKIKKNLDLKTMSQHIFSAPIIFIEDK